MGKQPASTARFDWARTRPGLYTALVDGIAYAITRLRRGRWELVAIVGTSQLRVLATTADTAHALRGYARRQHGATLATVVASNTSTGVFVGDAILSACRLPDASLTLTNEGTGWLASFATHPPGAQWIRYAAFKTTAAAALRQLDLTVRSALGPGGDLHAELTERVG